MKYAAVFLIVALVLTLGALAAFDRIEAGARADALAAAEPAFPPGDTLPSAAVPSPLAPTRVDYTRFAAADSAWRVEHAHQYTIAELQQRGNGKPTARQLMQDRVFEYTKHGRRAAAIADLERWVAEHPHDASALLSLARLLNADGQADAAVARYRQVLSLGGAIQEPE